MRKPTTSFLLWLLRFAVLASATLLCVCCTMQAQRTTHIPADVPTIQAAIDASTNGDTLLVAPGTYFENLNFHGKRITLRSAEGPAVTILDGRRLAPAVTFATGETPATTLAGFTLRNGGILLVSSSPTITGNTLTQNLCTALDATDSSPTFTRNTITQTEPTILCLQPTASIVLRGGAPTLIHNLIEHNHLTGIAVLDSHATLQNNILRYNTTTDVPSALSIDSLQNILLQQNLIVANTSRCGPAVFLSAPRAQILNNTIADNLSSPSCPPSSPASELDLGTPPLLIANNILASTSTHPALRCSAAIDLPHNLLHNPSGPTLANTCEASGALLADPAFVDPTQSDYHLSPHSPALDSGAISITPLPAHDLDDTPRLHNNLIDLGAYEQVTPRTLAASTTSLLATPNPAEAFQSITLTAQITSANTTPTGSVTFASNAQTLAAIPLDASGHASFTTTTLASGTALLTATYAGSDTLAPSTASQTQRISPATTLLSFSLTPSTADDTQTITLAASAVAPLSTQIPTGQIQFLALNPLSAPTLLATASLDPAGHATATLPAMSSGTWLIDAAYLGSPNFSAVTLPASDALTLSIAARGYTLSSATPTLTVQSGHHTTLALTLKSLGTFASTLSLTCANLPANASCAFSPASPGLTAGATIPVTLTVDTDAIPGFLSVTHPAPGPTLAALPLLALLGLRRRRRIGALLCLLAGITGCSSKYPAQVPGGTYTFQVVSQPSGSVAQQTLQLALIVTN